MNKRFFLMFFCVYMLAFLSFPGIAGAPAPPSLPSTAGIVKKDYVDQSRVKKVYYTMVKADGTMQETWSEEKKFQEKIEKAAFEKKEIEVWCLEDGEIYGLSINY